MKKQMTLVVTVMLLLALGSLGACSDSDDVPDTSAPASQAPSSDPGKPTVEPADEYAWVTEMFGEVPDPAFTAAQFARLQAGDISVGFCLLDYEQSHLIRMANGFTAFWEELGASNGGVFSADGDVTVQAAQIENCGTLGLDLICVASTAVASLSNACETVMGMGTMVIVSDGASVENCGFVPTGLELYPNYDIGWYMADMAVAYMNEYNPGMKKVKVATGGLSETWGLAEMFSGAYDRIALDDRAEIVYVQDTCLTIEDGYNTAKESLANDSGIRVFLTFNEAPAIGFSGYVTSQLQYNPGEFIAVPASASVESEELWEMSKTNLSVMRGYVGLAWQDVSEVISLCSYKCLLGLVDTANCYIEIGLPVFENAFGYEPVGYSAP